MTKMSENLSPFLTLVEGAAPSNPAAGDHRLYVDTADKILKWKDSAGTVRTPGTPADILDLPTAEMTATKVLAPDGAGGVEFRAEAGGLTFSGAKVHPSNGTFGSGSYTAVPFAGTEDWDTDGYHDPVTNNTRLTIPTGKGGKFVVWYSQCHSMPGFIYIRKNGTAVVTNYSYTAGTGSTITGTIYDQIALADGDYIEAMTNVASGTLTTDATFGIQKIA